MKVLKTLSFILILMLTAQISFAVSGKVTGTVKNSDNGKKIANAAVFLVGTEFGDYSDVKGHFLIENVPEGEYSVRVTLLGFKSEDVKVNVKGNQTQTVNISVKSADVELESFTVSATRAKERETPVAFSNVTKEEILNKATTEDMPELLDDTPGLFSSSTGLGESEITMRGFEADKIQILINGIPVNDPESQKVYWSNWTGISSNAKSVQVQRGAGSSMYGSGAFGGSINIETIEADPKHEFTLRTSGGYFFTDGKSADGNGNIDDYRPGNYNVQLKYSSGHLYRGKFNYNLTAERKAGDSYLRGTDYDGWSFGVETQSVFGDHSFNLSFIGAPQEHHNTYTKNDEELMKVLGREYNRANTPAQKNTYYKPQISLRHEWTISDESKVLSNLFYTSGTGGGRYWSQDNFNVENGEVTQKELFDWDAQNAAFGSHALYVFEQTNGECMMEGFEADTSAAGTVKYYYNGKRIRRADNLFASPKRYDMTWTNYSVSNHKQYGFNTYYENQITDGFKLIMGGEARYWDADHYREIEDFRYNALIDSVYEDADTVALGNHSVLERSYDYTSKVLNASAFARFQIKPVDDVTLLLDGQFARYSSEIEENPIKYYDLETGNPTDFSYYTSKEDKDENGNLKFDEDDYKKVFKFFSPKFGVNWNLTEEINMISNYSIAYKEPKTRDWYHSYDGPDGRQMYTVSKVKMNEETGLWEDYEEDVYYGELDPEQINTIEFGFGYHSYIFGGKFKCGANYYNSKYTDKIERADISVVNEYASPAGDSTYTDERSASVTINAGKARHQGVEADFSYKLGQWDANGSATWAHNRWISMSVGEIFGVNSEDMKDKTVPYSPEIMINSALGYTFDFNNESDLRVGMNHKYWDGYYANHANEYAVFGDPESQVATDTLSSKLPDFSEFSLNLRYAFKLNNKDCSVRLDINNVFNQKNYSSARVSKDYNRGTYVENEDGETVWEYDEWRGKYKLYYTPAPLLNLFLTMEYKF
ncbi:MAG: hypothetical protein CSB55_05115 [Candidatus Cloacimonadota bacterium]|nr:MAG: hypothetical protein CSB55_05115 [Candidatus Cloacimonadota bacterium]